MERREVNNTNSPIFMKKMKHAYLIIAHNEPLILNTLISFLDDLRNDIYILIDRKANIQSFKFTPPNHSRLYVLPQKLRISICHGGFSQVKAEMTLFKYSHSNGDRKSVV